LEKEKKQRNNEQNETKLIGYEAELDLHYQITRKIPLYYDKNINGNTFIESFGYISSNNNGYNRIIIIYIENLYKFKNLIQVNIDNSNVNSNIIQNFMSRLYSANFPILAFVFKYHGNNVLSSIELPVCKNKGIIDIRNKQIFKTSYINLLNTHPTIFKRTKYVDDYLETTQFH